MRHRISALIRSSVPLAFSTPTSMRRKIMPVTALGMITDLPDCCPLALNSWVLYQLHCQLSRDFAFHQRTSYYLRGGFRKSGAGKYQHSIWNLVLGFNQGFLERALRATAGRKDDDDTVDGSSQYIESFTSIDWSIDVVLGTPCWASYRCNKTW